MTTFHRFLIDLDGISERRINTTRLQKKFGASTKTILADLAHLDTVFNDLTIVSKVSSLCDLCLMYGSTHHYV